MRKKEKKEFWCLFTTLCEQFHKKLLLRIVKNVNVWTITKITAIIRLVSTLGSVLSNENLSYQLGLRGFYIDPKGQSLPSRDSDKS